MRAYILRTDRTIEPFGDPVGESLHIHRPLREAMRETLAGEGLEVREVASPSEIEGDDYLLLFDHVFISRKLARDFIHRLRDAEGTVCVALAVTEMIRSTLPLQEVRRAVVVGVDHALFDCYRVQGTELRDAADSGEVLRRLRETARPLCVPARSFTFDIGGVGMVEHSRERAFDFSASFAMHLSHWIHLLRLNQMASALYWADYLRTHRWRILGLIGLAFVRGRRRVGRRLVHLGEGCDIHPTATIEASVIGNHVRIGAHCLVRRSFVGDRAVLMDNTKLVGSVMGQGCLALHDLYMVGCMCYPGSTLSNYKVQLSLLGRDIFLTADVALVDARFEGEVRVEHRGKLVGTGTRYLGSCIGHGARLGGRTAIAAGRSVPNGYTIVAPPEWILSRIPGDLPRGEPLVVRDGTLVPLK